MAHHHLPAAARAPITPASDVCTHPLWALTVVLGDVARRVERHRAAEQTETSPETRRSPGSDPAAPGETA